VEGRGGERRKRERERNVERIDKLALPR